VRFNLKCLTCGHVETEEVPPGLKGAPPCSKCTIGVVIATKVLSVPVKSPPPRRGWSGSGYLRNRRAGRD
jgi:hypothetical protein